MIIVAQQTRDYLLIPLLKRFDNYQQGFYKESAVYQLLGTIATESKFAYLRQLGYDYEDDGGAFGPYQIEMETLYKTKEWLQKKYPELAHKIELVRSSTLTDKENLIGNFNYATLIARSVYFSINRPLPEMGDVQGMGEYWHDYYNRNENEYPAKFVHAYNRFL